MKRFRIFELIEFNVYADFEEEAIQQCKEGKYDSKQSRYIRF